MNIEKNRTKILHKIEANGRKMENTPDTHQVINENTINIHNANAEFQKKNNNNNAEFLPS